MIWNHLLWRSMFVERVNPSDTMRFGDVFFDSNHICVQGWLRRKNYAIKDVLGVRARIQVDYGLEEFFEVEVLLKSGYRLRLDVSKPPHRIFASTIGNLPEADLSKALNQLFDPYVTDWTFLSKFDT